MNEQTIHEWFLENVPAYVAGGLAGDERQKMTAHAAIGAACEAALALAIAADRGMAELFEEVRPGAEFEESVVAGWRDGTASRRRLVHPAWRYAGGVAAAVVLGFIGFVGSHAV